VFDSSLRKLINAPLDAAGARLARLGVGADQVTVAGFAAGIVGAVLIGLGHFWLALAAIVLGRLADGLDGAVARATRRTDRGGYLDIVLDFLFYAAVPLAFAVHDPASNALAAAFLLAGIVANGAAFLAFAIMAEKRALTTRAQGLKSLYYLAGLMEGGETIVFFVAFCLFPGWFAVLACVFAALCLASALGRIVIAWHVFD